MNLEKYTKELQYYLHKKISRKEFLVTIGLLLLSLSGLAGAYKNFKETFYPYRDKGFGSGVYGGDKS